MTKLGPIDRLFIRCVKEEIADGETVTIEVYTHAHVAEYERHFTDEELDSITFRVASSLDPEAA